MQQQLLFLLGTLPRFSGAALDARGIGMQLAEAARQEWGPSMVAQIMLTEGWYREHMPPVKADLEDKTTTLPKHADVKDDFRLIRIINGVPRVPDTRTGEKGKKRHGDSAIAYALARYAVKNLSPDEPFICVSGAPLSASTLPAGF